MKSGKISSLSKTLIPILLIPLISGCYETRRRQRYPSNNYQRYHSEYDPRFDPKYHKYNYKYHDYNTNPPIVDHRLRREMNKEIYYKTHRANPYDPQQRRDAQRISNQVRERAWKADHDNRVRQFQRNEEAWRRKHRR